MPARNHPPGRRAPEVEQVAAGGPGEGPCAGKWLPTEALLDFPARLVPGVPGADRHRRTGTTPRRTGPTPPCLAGQPARPHAASLSPRKEGAEAADVAQPRRRGGVLFVSRAAGRRWAKVARKRSMTAKGAIFR